MSVINKMLRDLDQRQGGAVAARTGHESAALGTAPLAASPATARTVPGQRRLVWIGGLLFLAMAAMAGLWYQQSSQRDAGSSPVVAIATPSPAPDTVTSAPEAAVPEPTPSTAVPDVPAQISSANAQAPRPNPKTVQKKEVAAAAPARQVTTALPTVKAVSQPVAKAQLPATDRAPSKEEKPAMLKTAQVPVEHNASEALALANSLWDAGSRAAALDVLRQALSKLEVTSAVAMPVTAQSGLARVASELARMALAEGQVSQALALLARLEPQLSQIAEAWAMRGNAAQRLAQHAQAVKSYQQALRLKPGEPRWMLGQAVSLAALGLISEAAELAEITRAMGALRPDVANYLRQLGVTVRTD